MSDEEKQQPEAEEATASDDGDSRDSDAETAFEEYTGDAKCPECDEPIIDVRANCPNCGYEYKESDYGDKEAGSEFVAGSAVDEEGNENPDDATGGAAEDGPDEEGSDEEGSDEDGGSQEE